MSKTALFKASKSWQAQAVAAILEKDPDLIHSVDARGRTALHLCAQHALGTDESSDESIRTARVLLEAGADVNAVEEIADDGQVFPATPLWYAVAKGNNRPLARFLLREGANADHCLWTVIWSDDAEMIRLLLKAGSRTDLQFNGETPLLYAARLGREAALLELLRAGADPKVKDAKGHTPLDYALKKRLGARAISALRGSIES